MKKKCPNCGKIYKTTLNRPKDDLRTIQQIHPNSTKTEREQLITGICSDKCWKEYTNS